MKLNDSEKAFIGLLSSVAGLSSSVVGLSSQIVDSVSNAMWRSKRKREQTRDQEALVDTDAIFSANARLYKLGNFPKFDDFMNGLYARYCEDAENGTTRFPHYEIRAALLTTCGDLYIAEGLGTAPSSPPSTTDAIALARYRDQMVARLKKAQNPNTLETIESILKKSIEQFIAQLPAIAIDATELDFSEQPKAPMIGLLDVLPDIPKALSALTIPLFSPDALELDLFKSTREMLAKNGGALQISSTDEYEGDPKTLARSLLRNTHFAPLLETRVPFYLPEETRAAGHWIIAPPGRGKTTLLHSMVNDDLSKDAAIILIDSKGDLIEPLKRLRAIKDRLILIEPSAESAFALNPLDLSNTTVMQVVSLIEYIMAGLLEAKFTALQSALFRNVVPAIFEAVQNPTLETFKEVMIRGLPAGSLDRVSPHARQFFDNRDTGFHSKTYDSTRKEIVWRLDYLLSNPILRSMFSATRTKLDIGKEMDAGRVIVINNSKAELGDEGAEFFGRFFIALIARAAQQRSGKPASAKKPCFVYIDECQSVIAKDTRIPILLDECRSQNIALILSHQRTAQLTPAVLDAVANCAIRMANSDDEAKYLADKLRLSADTLRSLPRGTFGTFVRDLTPVGILLEVPKIDLDGLPKMSEQELQAIRDRMRAEFSIDPVAPPTASPRTSAALPDMPAADEASQPHPADPGEPSERW